MWTWTMVLAAMAMAEAAPVKAPSPVPTEAGKAAAVAWLKADGHIFSGADAPPDELEPIAARLAGARVLLGVRGAPVGLAEPAQIRHDDVGRARQPFEDRPEVRTGARPAVQQDHRRPAARAVVGEGEPVDGGGARHVSSSPAPRGGPAPGRTRRCRAPRCPSPARSPRGTPARRRRPRAGRPRCRRRRRPPSSRRRGGP